MPPLPPIVWIAIALVILLLGDDFGEKVLGPDSVVDNVVSPDLQLMIFGITLALIAAYVIKTKSN